jgi:lipopolysaccharide/colanic/teichoic acid biosynthesis glycosyltransferase
MINNAHDQLVNNPNLSKQYESNTKIPDDHRVTRIGHFLRKYSIDELPQLWNILQGHMTLVGPRVLGDVEYGWYGRYGTKILSVKPGLTGLAQVKNRGGGIHRRIACDLYYLKNRNILLYFYILIHTVYIVIIGTGK